MKDISVIAIAVIPARMLFLLNLFTCLVSLPALRHEYYLLIIISKLPAQNNLMYIFIIFPFTVMTRYGMIYGVFYEGCVLWDMN